MFDSSGLKGPRGERAFRPRGDNPLCHHARFEIPTDEAKYSPIVDLRREFLHQEVVIDAVEEFLQVHVHHHPAAFGNVLPCRLDCLMRVSPRSEAVAVRVIPPPACGFQCSALRFVMTPVGSEEARLRAGLRPPLKLHVRFSRMQLSRWGAPSGSYRRDQSNQVHQPVLAIKLGCRQRLPARTAPALEPVRPNAPHDPAVESIEELSDVGSFEVVAPPSQYRVDPIDQLPGIKRYAPLRALAHLIHEPLD
jgi:hypothetical protein